MLIQVAIVMYHATRILSTASNTPDSYFTHLEPILTYLELATLFTGVLYGFTVGGFQMFVRHCAGH